MAAGLFHSGEIVFLRANQRTLSPIRHNTCKVAAASIDDGQAEPVEIVSSSNNSHPSTPPTRLPFRSTSQPPCVSTWVRQWVSALRLTATVEHPMKSSHDDRWVANCPDAGRGKRKRYESSGAGFGCAYLRRSSKKLWRYPCNGGIAAISGQNDSYVSEWSSSVLQTGEKGRPKGNVKKKKYVRRSLSICIVPICKEILTT